MPSELMTDERAAEMRERHRKATRSHPGWKHIGAEVYVCWNEQNVTIAEAHSPTWHEDKYCAAAEARRNAQFIAHAHQDIPDLLDERERLTAEVAQLKDRNERLGYDILNAQGM